MIPRRAALTRMGINCGVPCGYTFLCHLTESVNIPVQMSLKYLLFCVTVYMFILVSPG